VEYLFFHDILHVIIAHFRSIRSVGGLQLNTIVKPSSPARLHQKVCWSEAGKEEMHKDSIGKTCTIVSRSYATFVHYFEPKEGRKLLQKYSISLDYQKGKIKNKS